VKRFIGRLENRFGHGLEGHPLPETYDSIQVLHRGYIANSAELLLEGKRRGESLAGAPDGLFFAKAYSWWGDGLQSKVLGEYSVAIYDSQRLRLLLTHDALGLLPLFYADYSGTVVFASHLDWLVRFIGPGDLSVEYITELLTSGLHTGARTPYRKILRLLPGQSLTCADGGLVVRQTWSLASREPISYKTDEEYEERFRGLIGQGVSAALRGCSTVWGELSGGLDSSSVVSMAASSGTKLDTVSFISSQHRSGDETKWMRAVVEKYGLAWHVIDVDATPPFSEIPSEFYAEPNPTMIVEGIFRRYKNLLSDSHVDAVLSGDGGDNILMGGHTEPLYFADRFTSFRFRLLLEGLREWRKARQDNRPLLFLFVETVLTPLIDHIRGRPLRNKLKAGIPPYLHPRLRRIYQTRPSPRAAEKFRSVGDQYFAERLSQCGLTAGTSNDQRTGAFEFRFPLLYRPLVEFMFAIPWEQKLLPECDRHLQRRALKEILPETVRLRRGKRGSAEAYFEGLRHSQAWNEILTKNPLMVEYELVDKKTWLEAVAQARYGQTHLMSLFLSAATVEMWLRQLSKCPGVSALSELADD